MNGALVGRVLGILAAMALLVLVGFWNGGNRAELRCSKAGTPAVAVAAKTAASATQAAQTVADTAASKQVEIRTVFKDRIIKETVEVPREVIVRENAGCVIPGRFVGMWNSANRAELPTFAGQLDAAPSGVALSDVAAQHDREAELCHRNTEQLKALQAAERARQHAVEANQ